MSGQLQLPGLEDFEPPTNREGSGRRSIPVPVDDLAIMRREMQAAAEKFNRFADKLERLNDDEDRASDFYIENLTVTTAKETVYPAPLNRLTPFQRKLLKTVVGLVALLASYGGGSAGLLSEIWTILASVFGG